MPTPPIDADAIRYIRIRLGMSNAELADLIHYPADALLAAEEGTLGLPPWTVHRLRKVIGLAEAFGQLRDIVTSREIPATLEPQPGEHIGETIRRIRQALGIGQQELSAAAGLNFDTLRHIEYGRIVYPKRETLARIAKAMRIPLPPTFDDEP
jgi:DNA-binding XRE family transcriptional regulator